MRRSTVEIQMSYLSNTLLLLVCFKKHKGVAAAVYQCEILKADMSAHVYAEIPCVNPVSSFEPPPTTNLPTDTERPYSINEPSKVLRPPQIESTANLLVDIERPCYVDEPSKVLQQLQLESIASSSEIRDVLKNEDLQKLICNIDCSTDAQTELDKALDLEVFRLFTDKILATISK